MNQVKYSPGSSHKVLFLALLAICGQAYAADEETQLLTTPESFISMGIGNVSGENKDRTMFGQYNGLRTDNNNLLLDFSIVKLNTELGLWTNFSGRNLGLDNRELSLMQNKQGDWKYSVEYSEITRHDIRTINSGLGGAGTTTPVVNLLATAGSGNDFNLNIRRRNVSIGMEKWLTSSLQFEANFKNEDKDGARLFGKGFACSATWVTAGVCTASTTQWALLLLPEPINSNTIQFDARLNYSGDNFLLSGGYYGSFYTNANSTMSPTVPGTLNNPLGTPTVLDAGLQSTMALPVALPPDNQAHQLYISGNYAFTPSTRATFKYAYSHATQNEDFSSLGMASAAPAGVSSLNGVVDTNLAQLGLTSRPFSKLSLLANVRYEDKKDKTPVALYNVEGVTTDPANFFSNGLSSSAKLYSKAEASYQLPDKYRATLGLNYDTIDRGNPDSTNRIAGLSAVRAKNEETGYIAGLRRSMSETLNAAVSYNSSKRGGSDWYSLLTSAGAISAGAGYGNIVSADTILAGSANAIFPMAMADRQRDKVRLSMDWNALDNLSLQLVVEDGKDKYTTGASKGLQDNKTGLISVDAVYILSDEWKLTGYWSEGNQTLDVNHSSGYMAALENISTTFGLGIVGKPGSKLEIGGNLYYLNDKNRYGIGADAAANANNVAQAAVGLPDVTYRQTTLKLFGKYAVEKNATLRVDLIHQNTRLDEWTWGYNGTPFAYSDNTTVTLQPDQTVTFIGASYIYRMW